MLPTTTKIFHSMALVLLAGAIGATAQTYSATYTYNPANPTSLPETTEQGQSGTNQCGTGSNATSQCQNVFINSVTDFCLWGPPYSGPNATIADTERVEVAYCLQSGYGTRLFPDGTIQGAHFVQTPDYVQVSGWGDFTLIGIPAGDMGGELDPHGADGNGNPIGGLVFGSSFGSLMQYHEWTNFMAVDEFCIRACKPAPNAPILCNHIYDTLGCEWNMPANYDVGYFENCMADSALPMGVYGSSTFFQGEPVTPAAHPIPPSSECVRVASLTSYSPASTSLSSTVVITSNGTTQLTYLFTEPAPTTSTTAAPSVALPSQESALASQSAKPSGGSRRAKMTSGGLGLTFLLVIAICAHL